MDVFFGFGCNICYKTDDGSLKDISKENMKHLKDTLITFLGHAEIKYNELYLCQMCCDELIRFDKFRELCFSHLIQFRQKCFNMLSKVNLEVSREAANDTLKTFVYEEVLRRNYLGTNNCPVSVTTELNEVKGFADINESDLDFNGQVINLQSLRNKCEFVGDCSTGSVINNVIKCDESQVAFTNEKDIKNVMIRRSEHTKLEIFDVSNVSDTSQIQFMKEEVDLNDEIKSSDSEIFTLTSFENKSGEQANLDVKKPVVNDSSDTMKQELHVKQENSHSEGVLVERIADEFGGEVQAAFEIANVCTIVNERNGKNEDIRNQEGKIGMKLRRTGRNNKTTASIINTHSSRAHAREGRNGPSLSALQSTASKRLQSGGQLHTSVAGNQSSKTRSSLVRHERIPSGGRRYKCTVCNKAFGQSNTLTIHKRTHRPYKCTVCNKAFAQPSNLTRHKRLHSGDKPYKCTVCNKAFAQPSNLTTHKRLHSGDKPYKCTVCKKAFSDPSALIKHKRIHSGDKPYKCTVCNKAFSDPPALIRHKRIHRGDKPYKCTVCNKAFSGPSALIKHKRIHSGDKPHKCTACNKAFAHSTTLTIHKRIHSNDRPYKCTVCNKAFAQSTNLMRHKRTHVGDRP